MGEEVEPSALTQRRSKNRLGKGGVLKVEAAGNSRLGCCGVPVSRADHFCTRENPFVPQ